MFHASGVLVHIENYRSMTELLPGLLLMLLTPAQLLMAIWHHMSAEPSHRCHTHRTNTLKQRKYTLKQRKFTLKQRKYTLKLRKHTLLQRKYTVCVLFSNLIFILSPVDTLREGVGDSSGDGMNTEIRLNINRSYIISHCASVFAPNLRDILCKI